MKKYETLGKVLSKVDQRHIVGGLYATVEEDVGYGGACKYSGTMSNGQTWTNTVYMYGSCSQQSSGMNNLCVGLITDGYLGNCHYDCGCDGWGA